MQKKFVTNGACLRCSAGSQTCKLSILPKQIEIESESVATETDALPMVNIQSFGFCSIKPGPCIPITIKWENPISSVTISGASPISDRSILPCAVGGVIMVESVPQDTVYNQE